MTKPMVSVVMITYGHEQYIKQAIEGVLMQQCDFEVELIIANDCSPDNTDSVVDQLKEKHHNSNCIKYTRHNSNKGMTSNFIWALEQANGKYIALCEGDDYWTDAIKLQKQVDFLESNTMYTLCCGGFRSKNTTNDNISVNVLGKYDLNDANGFSFTHAEMSQTWIVKTFTSVFRRTSIDFSLIDNYSYFRDIHLFYHILKHGKGYYFNTIFGFYTIHLGGVNSMQHGEVNFNASYKCYKELHKYNNDEFTRVMCLKGTLSLLSFNLYNDYSKNTFGRRVQLFKEALVLVRNFAEVKWLFNSFFSVVWRDRMKKLKFSIA